MLYQEDGPMHHRGNFWRGMGDVQDGRPCRLFLVDGKCTLWDPVSGYIYNLLSNHACCLVGFIPPLESINRDFPSRMRRFSCDPIIA